MKQIILAVCILTTQTVIADVWLGTNLIYRSGSTSTCGIPKTGVTVSYNVGDDGYYQAGVALPNPLWAIVGADGTAETNQVRHIPSGLIFARNIDGLIPATNYVDALALCEALVYGGTNDWRMPNRNEMLAPIALQYGSPALSDQSGTEQWTYGNPWFLANPATAISFWTSTPYAGSVASRWYVQTRFGVSTTAGTNSTYYCWPVRGP